MPTVSLYRKYRSQTFGDLVGQDHVVRTLQNAITSGRISHSFLFTGPRGTGKTSTARLLAKALCCEHGPTAEPDNTCAICREITAGTCVDVMELDAASESGVDDIRDTIVEVVEYQPMIARYKVFIIDEVHDLSPKAFDALLKTIEEPPDHVIFILATTEYSKVPPTIRSRCQKFEFHRASMQDLIGRLNYVCEQEGVQTDPAALTAIARMADGGYRDALTLIEQAMLTSDGRITLEQVYDQLGMVSEEQVDEILLAMRSGDIPKIMDSLAEIARRGRDPRSIVESVLYRLADLTRASYQVGIGAGDSAQEAALYDLAGRLGRDHILRLRSELSEAHKVIRDISLPRLWLESELIRLAAMPAPAPAAAVAPMPAAAPISRPRPVERKPSAEDLAATLVAPPKPEAETKPDPKPEPAPEPVRAVVDTPGPATTVIKTPEEVWTNVIESINERYYGKVIALRVAGSKVVGFAENVLEVQLLREIDVDWFKETSARSSQLAKLVHEHGGHGWRVNLTAPKRSIKIEEPVAVELPAEGEQLHQVAQQIFGQNSSEAI